jgi:hypothetical protein
MTKKKSEKLGIDDLPKKSEPLKAQPVPVQGWVCPVCGKGNSPYNTVCPCGGRVYPWVNPYPPIDPWTTPYPHDPWSRPYKITWEDPRWPGGPTCYRYGFGDK